MGNGSVSDIKRALDLPSSQDGTQIIRNGQAQVQEAAFVAAQMGRISHGLDLSLDQPFGPLPEKGQIKKAKKNPD